jgi:5'-phosphate synthase pdxT subunit
MLDREHLDVFDAVAKRNAFGAQVHSFEADLAIDGLDGGPLRAVFIRAPWIAEHGEDVKILASVDGHPVAARQGEVTVVSFHPELTRDTRLHAAFLQQVRARRAQGARR